MVSYRKRTGSGWLLFAVISQSESDFTSTDLAKAYTVIGRYSHGLLY